MLIDRHEVRVTIDSSVVGAGEVMLDIEATHEYDEQHIVLAMTREQAMSLGGLLIGMATAGGVPLVDSEVVTQEQVDALNTVLAVPSGELRSSAQCVCPKCAASAEFEGYCSFCQANGCS